MWPRPACFVPGVGFLHCPRLGQVSLPHAHGVSLHLWLPGLPSLSCGEPPKGGVLEAPGRGKGSGNFGFHGLDSLRLPRRHWLLPQGQAVPGRLEV